MYSGDTGDASEFPISAKPLSLLDGLIFPLEQGITFLCIMTI